MVEPHILRFIISKHLV